MAQYSVAAPDGSIVDLTGPDGASEEEIKTQAHKIYLQNQELQKTAQATAAQAKVAQAQAVNAPVESFASSAINALGFGLPEYLGKKYGTVTQTPQQAAQVYEQRDINNPIASKAGELTGDVAGLVVPAGLGAKVGYKAANAGLKGYETAAIEGKILEQLTKSNPAVYAASDALKAAETAYRNGVAGAGEALIAAERNFNALTAPLIANARSSVSKFLTPTAKIAATGTGGAMGAQTGAAIPNLIQGDVPGAVAKSAEMGQTIGQLPVVGPTYAATAGQAVPAGIAALNSAAPYIASGIQAMSPQSSLERMIRELAAKYALTNAGQQRP